MNGELSARMKVALYGLLCVLLVVALIPDVGFGRHTQLNDAIGSFEGAFGGNGSEH